MSLTYYFLSRIKSDTNLGMGNTHPFPLKAILLQVHNTTADKPPHDNNTVENNGSQLTGGALTSVVMATMRRVANLPCLHITDSNKKITQTNPPSQPTPNSTLLTIRVSFAHQYISLSTFLSNSIIGMRALCFGFHLCFLKLECYIYPLHTHKCYPQLLF